MTPPDRFRTFTAIKEQLARPYRELRRLVSLFAVGRSSEVTNARVVATIVAANVSALAVGCTSFATVRSAEVRPGPELTTQISTAASPGPVAGWLWSFDCAEECDQSIPSLDVTFAYGQRKDNETPYALGVGLSGTFPFAEGYVQLRSAERYPFGVGARVGIPAAAPRYSLERRR